MTQFERDKLEDAQSWAVDVEAEAREHLDRLAAGERTFGLSDVQLIGQLSRIAGAAARLHRACKEATRV